MWNLRIFLVDLFTLLNIFKNTFVKKLKVMTYLIREYLFYMSTQVINYIKILVHIFMYILWAESRNLPFHNWLTKLTGQYPNIFLILDLVSWRNDMRQLAKSLKKKVMSKLWGSVKFNVLYCLLWMHYTLIYKWNVKK